MELFAELYSFCGLFNIFDGFGIISVYGYGHVYQLSASIPKLAQSFSYINNIA